MNEHEIEDAREYAVSMAQSFGLDKIGDTVARFEKLERDEPHRRKPAGFWAEVRAEMERLAAIPAPEFWAFNSTGDAYDACQCDARIKSGAMLVIESEQVVGLAWAWPVAITAEAGNLHEAKSPAIVTNPDDMGASAEQLAAAKAECAKRGWPIHAVFPLTKPPLSDIKYAGG